MLHLLPKRPAPDVELPASAAVGVRTDRFDMQEVTVEATRDASTPVLITEEQVVFATAAAAMTPPANTNRRRVVTTMFAAVRSVHIALPEPRPCYPRRYGVFEAARMSREMDHL